MNQNGGNYKRRLNILNFKLIFKVQFVPHPLHSFDAERGRERERPKGSLTNRYELPRVKDQGF